MVNKYPLIITSIILSILTSPVNAVVDDTQVIALSAADGRVVIKEPGGQVSVVQTGDVIPGTQTKLVQVLQDRIVAQDASDPGNRYWIYRQRDGVSMVTPLSRRSPNKSINQ